MTTRAARKRQREDDTMEMETSVFEWTAKQCQQRPDDFLSENVALELLKKKETREYLLPNYKRLLSSLKPPEEKANAKFLRCYEHLTEVSNMMHEICVAKTRLDDAIRQFTTTASEADG